MRKQQQDKLFDKSVHQVITYIKRIKIQTMVRHILLYGLVTALLIFILKWLQWKYLITHYSLEIYLSLMALLFTGLGVWIAWQLVSRKERRVVVEKEVPVFRSDDFVLDEAQLEKLNLSNREYEVLQYINHGYSNAEIADALFVSLSTVKTHVSNIFVKLNVKNRTQAINKARHLNIIP